MKIRNFILTKFSPEGLEEDVSGVSRRLVWLSALVVGFLLIWAAVAEIDEIVRGRGQVVPSQRVQLIQNLEGGIVREIFVREGQEVTQNAILMQIDNETAGSQYREALLRSLEHEASLARLEALIANAEPTFSPEVLAIPELMARQRDLLTAAKKQTEAELSVLALQSKSRQQEAIGLKERQTQLKAALVLAERQRELARPALAAKVYSELEFLDLEQRVQSLKTDLAELTHDINQAEANANEAEERLNLRRAELESSWRAELNETQIQLLALRELLSAGDDKVRRTEMRSPVRGIIKTIHANTLGGVVGPGATVMEVVPLDDSLIIEANFNPSDIAFIYPGQKAQVRLTAYDFTTYGGLPATVETIGADTLADAQGTSYYKVKIRTNSAHLDHEGQPLPIMPGMLAEVDVITGKKTILDYLLKPLFRLQQRAFRER